MSRMNGDREKYFDTFFLSYHKDKSKDFNIVKP